MDYGALQLDDPEQVVDAQPSSSERIIKTAVWLWDLAHRIIEEHLAKLS